MVVLSQFCDNNVVYEMCQFCEENVLQMCTFFLAPVPHYRVPHYRASETTPYLMPAIRPKWGVASEQADRGRRRRNQESFRRRGHHAERKMKRH